MSFTHYFGHSLNAILIFFVIYYNGFVEKQSQIIEILEVILMINCDIYDWFREHGWP